ncbi:MAG: hypothetical protein FWH01_04250 [Oscillospiraceae bacterium]|nr:hypothetical protein [Oscillospiraceae bacterium]
MVIPSDYWQASQIDGQSHFGYLLRIVMPLSGATIISASLLAFRRLLQREAARANRL